LLRWGHLLQADAAAGNESSWKIAPADALLRIVVSVFPLFDVALD
jgi:hypothetical protein